MDTAAAETIATVIANPSANPSTNLSATPDIDPGTGTYIRVRAGHAHRATLRGLVARHDGYQPVAP